MKKRISLIAILFVLGFIINACNKSKAIKANEESDTHKKESTTSFVELSESQFKNAGIVYGTIENRGLSDALTVTGFFIVPPQNQASVSSYMGGIVKSINVIQGSHVSKSQTLATIEHPDIIKLQQDYLETKSNFDFLKKDYERQSDLQKSNVNAGKTFQEAESRYNVIKARLVSLESQLSMLSIPIDKLGDGNLTKVIRIKSPIAGYIGNINIKMGSYIEPNKELFSVIDNSKLHIDLNVYEKDLNNVQVGQKVDIVITNQPDKHIEAKIFSIDKSFTNETKSVTAHAEIINGDKSGLIAGMFLNAIIHSGEKLTLALPEDAIVSLEGKEYIFIATDEGRVHNHKEQGKEKPIEYRFKPVEIKTGVRELGYVEVLLINKIPDNSRIAIKGAYFILSQMKLGEGAGCVDDL